MDEELDNIFSVIEKSDATASNFEKGIEHFFSKTEKILTKEQVLLSMKEALFDRAFNSDNCAVAKAVAVDYFIKDVVKGEMLTLYMQFAIAKEKGDFSDWMPSFVKALYGVAGHAFTYQCNKANPENYQAITPDEFKIIIEHSDVLKSYTDSDPFTVETVRENLQSNIDDKVDQTIYDQAIQTLQNDKVDQSTYESDQQSVNETLGNLDQLIAGKVDQSTYDADKQETQGALDNVYTKSEVYTKTEVDNALADKADSNTVNEQLELKADKSYVDEELGKKADSATTLAGYGITDAYTKDEVDAKVASVYKFKGSVATVEDLPVEGNVEGDVYNVLATGENYAWVAPAEGEETGHWDDLGGDVDLTSYLTKDEASTTYETIANVASVKSELEGKIEEAKNEAIGSANAAAHKEVYANGELTPSGGVATWTITHTLGTADVTVLVKEVATGEEVVTDVLQSANTVVIRMNASATITAGTYKAVIIG